MVTVHVKSYSNTEIVCDSNCHSMTSFYHERSERRIPGKRHQAATQDTLGTSSSWNKGQVTSSVGSSSLQQYNFNTISMKTDRPIGSSSSTQYERAFDQHNASSSALAPHSQAPSSATVDVMTPTNMDVSTSNWHQQASRAIQSQAKQPMNRHATIQLSGRTCPAGATRASERSSSIPQEDSVQQQWHNGATLFSNFKVPEPSHPLYLEHWDQSQQVMPHPYAGSAEAMMMPMSEQLPSTFRGLRLF